jgi:hypothetical protein
VTRRAGLCVTSTSIRVDAPYLTGEPFHTLPPIASLALSLTSDHFSLHTIPSSHSQTSFQNSAILSTDH